MNKDETSKLLVLITQTYPNFKLTNPGMAVAMWQKIFEDDDPLAVQNAFIEYAKTDTSGFAPSPGVLHMKVVGKMTEELSDDTVNETIAQFEKAARNGLYGAEEEFRSFTKIAQKAIGSPATIKRWATMDEKSRHIDMTKTAQVYQQLCERAKNDMAVRRISEGRYRELMSALKEAPVMIIQQPEPEVRPATQDEIDRTVFIRDDGVRVTKPPKEKMEALMEKLKHAT